MSLTSLIKLKPFSLAPPSLLILPLILPPPIPTLTVRGGFNHGRGRGRFNDWGLLPNPSPSFPSSNTFCPNSRPVWQLCNKPSHFVATCYHHFNHAYFAHPLSPLVNYSTLFSPSFSSTVWYPDTTATHHFTSMLLTSTWVLMFIRALIKSASMMAPIFLFNTLVMLILTHLMVNFF